MLKGTLSSVVSQSLAMVGTTIQALTQCLAFQALYKYDAEHGLICADTTFATNQMVGENWDGV